MSGDAERIAALEGALTTAANALDWAARRMACPGYSEVIANDCRQARAALTATEGEG